MPVSRSASAARYWSHTIHESRCQFVDFRHAFLELRPDRIREVVKYARAHAHAHIHVRIIVLRGIRIFCRFVEKHSNAT